MVEAFEGCQVGVGDKGIDEDKYLSFCSLLADRKLSNSFSNPLRGFLSLHNHKEIEAIHKQCDCS